MYQPSRKKIDPRAPVSKPPTPRQETSCTGLLPGFGRMRMSPPKYIQREGTFHAHDGRSRYSAMDVPGTAHDRMPHQSRTTFTHCTDRIIPPHTLIRQSSHFNRTILAYQSNSLHPNRRILAHNNRTVLALQSGNIHTPIGQCSHINRKLITPQSGDLHTPIG